MDVHYRIKLIIFDSAQLAVQLISECQNLVHLLSLFSFLFCCFFSSFAHFSSKITKHEDCTDPQHGTELIQPLPNYWLRI